LGEPGKRGQRESGGAPGDCSGGAKGKIADGETATPVTTSGHRRPEEGRCPL
jgi:hypothetical protein